MVAPGRNERGLTAPEATVALVVLMGMFAVMLAVYGSQMRRINEGIMTAQLRAMRTQVRVFRAVKGRWPEDIKELVHSPWNMFPLGAFDVEEEPVTRILKEEIEINYAVDELGFPVDPWGGRYAYDPENGKVGSAQERYSDW